MTDEDTVDVVICPHQTLTLYYVNPGVGPFVVTCSKCGKMVQVHRLAGGGTAVEALA